MPTSFIYVGSRTYELAMMALYGRYYFARYRALANLIPPSSSVLDLCCGPATLYLRYLRPKGVAYTGLDINKGFIRRLNECGGTGVVWDLRTEEPLPAADFVIMQASLYHFLPDARRVVDRMLQAARSQVIIAEPVRNLAGSKSRLLAAMGKNFTKASDGPHVFRFTEETADQFFSAYATRLRKTLLIPGGREKVYVLDAK